MILIADSGSTKCEWIEINGEKDVKKFDTVGLNPAYLTEGEISGIINASIELLRNKEVIEEIYFFGAGCGEAELAEKVSTIFSHVFYNAKSIHVTSDVGAAVLATADGPSLVGIIGTGCNICFYDGKSMDFRVPSMGYSLIDDGSGTSLGRKLLRAYYFKTMPEDLMAKFENQYELDPNKVKEKLYRSQNPSQYLASFVPFLFENKDHAYSSKILEETLNKYFDKLLAPYSGELKNHPLNLVGSIAYFGKDVIEKICKDRAIQLGNVVRNPIDTLVEHRERLKDL